MDDLRNLVSGQGCDDGSGGGYRNPLSQFVDHMWRDQSQREQEEFKRQNAPELNTSHEDTLSTHTTGMNQQQIEGFLNNFDERMGRMNKMDPLGYYNDEYDRYDDYLGPPGRNAQMRDQLNISHQVPPDLINEYIRSQRQGQHTYRPMPIPGEMGFRDLNKMNQPRVHVSPPYLQRDPRERMTRPDQTDKLVEEFEGLRVNGELDHTLDEHKFEEYDRIFREKEAHRMAEEFESFRAQRDFEQYYREANQAERWVDEFEGVRPIEHLDSKQGLRDVTEAISNIPDPKLQNSNFMQFIRKLNNGQVKIEEDGLVENDRPIETSNSWADEFAQEFGVEDRVKLGEDASQWAEEFEKKFGAEDDFMGHPWMNEFKDFENDQWVNDFHNLAYLKDYEFTEASENPYVDHANPMEKGLELFREGRLAESILAFEAHLMRNPQDSKGWQHLGQAHAENDKDIKAISALIRATETDPNNTDALSALAVSYTNELYREQALDVLTQWLEKHPEYAHLRLPPLNKENFDDYHRSVTDLYIKAARMRPNNPDADVQTALGLLFNLSLEYDKAVDCFKSALTVRPDDYLLWNKLGATLANSNRSEEAIGCYFSALQHKPTFVRARANLGISFMALQEYEKAATYFLQALSLHPSAKHIWSNLNMVFLSMGREDLVQRSLNCGESNVDVFRDEFDF